MNEPNVLKIGIMPKGVKEIVYDDPTVTIGDLFAMAGMTVDENFKVRVMGMDKKIDEPIGEVPAGASVIASRQIRGN